MQSAPLIHDQVAIVAVLLVVLAALFLAARHAIGKRVFSIVPLLVFAYFVPTLLSNLGIIPIDSPVYGWIKTWLLPASLVLLTLSVDIRGIVGEDLVEGRPSPVPQRRHDPHRVLDVLVRAVSSEAGEPEPAAIGARVDGRKVMAPDEETLAAYLGW